MGKQQLRKLIAPCSLHAEDRSGEPEKSPVPHLTQEASGAGGETTLHIPENLEILWAPKSGFANCTYASSWFADV